jgi:hypothetical protein
VEVDPRYKPILVSTCTVPVGFAYCHSPNVITLSYISTGTGMQYRYRYAPMHAAETLIGQNCILRILFYQNSLFSGPSDPLNNIIIYAFLLCRNTVDWTFWSCMPKTKLILHRERPSPGMETVLTLTTRELTR